MDTLYNFLFVTWSVSLTKSIQKGLNQQYFKVKKTYLIFPGADWLYNTRWCSFGVGVGRGLAVNGWRLLNERLRFVVFGRGRPSDALETCNQFRFGEQMGSR